MVEQIDKQMGRTLDGYLMDGGCVAREGITELERQGITVYAPTRAPRTETSGRSQAEPQPGDTPEAVAWRARMATEGAKAIYKERAATAECVNAQGRRYGLRQLLVRGADKVLSVLLLVAVTHNVWRWIALTSS